MLDELEKITGTNNKRQRKGSKDKGIEELKKMVARLRQSKGQPISWRIT